MSDTATIDQALDAILDDQRARLSNRTYRNYEDVIRLLRDSLRALQGRGLSRTGYRRVGQGVFPRRAASALPANYE